MMPTRSISWSWNVIEKSKHLHQEERKQFPLQAQMRQKRLDGGFWYHKGYSAQA
jgi:hypothetical protein